MSPFSMGGGGPHFPSSNKTLSDLLEDQRKIHKSNKNIAQSLILKHVISTNIKDSLKEF